MNVSLSTQQLGAWLGRILALGAVVISAIPATDVPTSVRPFLTLAGGIILAVDRYVTDPSTGTTVAPAPTTGAPPAAGVGMGTAVPATVAQPAPAVSNPLPPPAHLA